jgi:ech hydrogenase subunit A
MNGVNVGDNKNFIGSFGEEKQLYTANWYMMDYLGEAKFLNPCIIVSAAVLVVMMCLIIGGAV